MSLSFILTLALALWGLWFSPPAIDVVDESENPAYANVYAAAWAAEWPDGSCTISVGQTWALHSFVDRVSIMTHEVGHCAGLEHDCETEVQTLMCQPELGAPSVRDYFNLWDAQATAPFRLVVGVAYDGE